MLGCQPLHIDGGFLIYIIMTYKFYDENGNSLELYKKNQEKKIVIELDELNTFELNEDEIEDLIFALNKLTNKKTFVWKALSNN